MHSKYSILLLIFFQINFSLFAQKVSDSISILENEKLEHENKIIEIEQYLAQLKLQKIKFDINSIGLPALNPYDTVIQHSAMSICYSEKHEQAKWVSHIILPDIKNGGFSRTNDFREDSLVKTGTAVKSDYWDSGYDRGHLAPSADFRWNLKALSESYLYSNMSPQAPEFNREIWAEIENTIRDYVTAKNEQVYVVTGGILTDSLPTIGKNKVSIPEMFYKVIIDIEGDTLTGIAFLLSNDKHEYPVFSYAVSIDSVEALTGIDFFPALPDSLENIIESQCDYKLWQVDKRKINVLPISRNSLPENTYNSIQARSHYDENITVCGTVVDVHLSKTDNIFINFDQSFPDQLFWCTIWKSDIPNFSYDPVIYLANQKMCVTGTVKEKYGKPSMSIRHEKQIQLLNTENPK